jgi:hypothetical protein
VSARAPGVLVVGADRSGTSTIARLVALHGMRVPPEHDLVAPRAENPRGVWESASLAEFNVRVLHAVGSDDRFPVALERGWQRDGRLEPLRPEARRTFAGAFPASPWVWKDPLLCLTLAFWLDLLDERPALVLVTRNPLEIAASGSRAWGRTKIYGLALWERYLREALGQIEGLRVLVTRYGDVVSDPLAWCTELQHFLRAADVPVAATSDDEVLAFVDPRLRHTEATVEDVVRDPDVSDPQRELVLALERYAGAHERFSPESLPSETPATEALFEERRRAIATQQQLEHVLEQEREARWAVRIRRSPRAAPLRPVYRGGRAVASATAERLARFDLRARIRTMRDPRRPLHVMHIGKTGGTALKYALREHESESRLRLEFRGHDVTLAQIPVGERYMFIVRDPLDRFISAFNGRLREDRPRYHYPWREEERAAFAIYRTPDELGRALSAAEAAERTSAARAMVGIGHVNTPYSFWFGDDAAFEARLDDLFFVALQDRLDDDFELLSRKLGLPASARLPEDETLRHGTPEGFETTLSDEARENLERWYAWDVAFVARCRELAPTVNAAVP